MVEASRILNLIYSRTRLDIIMNTYSELKGPVTSSNTYNLYFVHKLNDFSKIKF